MRSRWILATAIAAGLALTGLRAGSAAEVSYTLIRSEVKPRPAGAPAFVFAAAFHPEVVPVTAWDDRVLKIRRGGYNAVHVILPAAFGAEGGFKAAELDELLGRLTRAGLKAIVGTPAGVQGDWTRWMAALQPVLAQHAGQVLWLQANGAGHEALAAAARAAQVSLPVIVGRPAAVKSASSDDRPYREVAVAVALRDALAEGAEALTWDSPFAGVAPPVLAAGKSDLPPVVVGPDPGGLPLSYYEGRLFGQVAGCLGAALTEAKSVPGAGASAPGVTAVQRNAGRQGFLFVKTPAEPSDYHLTFTDPATGEKMAIPRQAGLRARSFGEGTRILPLNLPFPGGKVRYSTAEVYGIYRVGERTLLLITEDDGAKGEIALSLDTPQQPKVEGAVAPPLWDAKTHTLTLGFIPVFSDTYVTVGANLVVGVVTTERAHRTWSVRHKETDIPMVTSAYLVGEASTAEGKLIVPMQTQQGPAAVSMFTAGAPTYLAVDGLGQKMAAEGTSGAFTFLVKSPVFAAAEAKAPLVQVFSQARFQAGADPKVTDYARPDYPAAQWPEVGLKTPHGAGWYRLNFRVPAIPGWRVPWETTLHLQGTANVYLNGTSLGALAVEGEARYVDLYLPDHLLRFGAEQNTLAFSLPANTVVSKVGIAPWVEHAVKQRELVFTLP